VGWWEASAGKIELETINLVKNRSDDTQIRIIYLTKESS
jgi:hypothetical protein